VIKSRVFRFGSYELSTESGEIRKNGVLIRLAPQPFQVLLTLIEHAGELVDREELHRRLWGDDQLIVEFDAGLNRCIRQIRAALADSADAPRYIETEPRKGYRFIAAVETINGTIQAPPGQHTNPAPEPQPLYEPFVVPPAAPSADTSQPIGFRFRRFSLLFAAVAGGLAIAALYFLSPKWRRSREPASLAVVPLATGLGRQYSPSFSPDGRQVAFTWNPEHEGNFDIYKKTVGEASVVRLTTHPDIDYSPVWSPDGRWIAFCRGSDTRGGAVWLIPSTGGPERRIIALETIAMPNNRALSWSQDSQHLVVAEQLAGLSQDGLTLVDVETGDWKRLIMAGPGETLMHPSVSPDGKTLAFTNDTGHGVSAIYLLPFPDGLQPKLLSGQFSKREFRSVYNAQPTWTPDSSYVVFSSNVDGEHHLWLATVNSSASPQPLAALGDNLEDADISRVGQLAAGHGIYDRNIWRMQLPGESTATSHLPSLAIASTRDEGEPSISPDGSRIAFASNRSGYSEIWISLADGSKAMPLTSMHVPVTGSPAWSPDGSRIAFDSRAEGRPEIYLESSSGGTAQQLKCGPGSNVAPTWSPDGKWIYFSSDRSGQMEIWRMTALGTTEVQVTTGGGFASKLSPDGRFLYFTINNAPTSPLWQLNLRTGNRNLIHGSAFKRAYVPTNNGVYYFSRSSDGETVLFFYDVKNAKATRIFSTDRLVDGGAAIDPSGRFLYYTQVDQNGHDLILASNFWK
jgi:Tol biopolymer transport system component/DNA-binding winged helix-turn-helix (wHTH) protein